MVNLFTRRSIIKGIVAALGAIPSITELVGAAFGQSGAQPCVNVLYYNPGSFVGCNKNYGAPASTGFTECIGEYSPNLK